MCNDFFIGEIMTINIIYIIFSVVLVGFTIWQRFTIVLAAKRNMFVQAIWVILAAVMAFLTYKNAHNLDILLGGIFITVFFLAVALWHPGLSQWGVFKSMRQILSYQAFTRIETEKVDEKITTLKMYSGDVLVVQIKLKSTPKKIEKFLSTRIKPLEELW